MITYNHYENLPLARETGVQYQVESYLKNGSWYLFV